jgi:hypothetical protein
MRKVKVFLGGQNLIPPRSAKNAKEILNKERKFMSGVSKGEFDNDI